MAGRVDGLMPSPARERMTEMKWLIERMVADVEAGHDAGPLIARLSEQAGPPGYDRESFAELYGWTSLEDLAELVALGPPPALPDMSEEEIKACLRIVGSGREPHVTFHLRVLERSFPGLPVSDLIFHPDKELSDEDLAAEILRRGRESGPILL